MTLFALFIALFPAMLYLSRLKQSPEQAAALAELEMPFADDAKAVLEAATDGGLYLLRGVFALVLWAFGLFWGAANRVFARSFSDRAEQFAQWLCKVFGAGFDPNGSTLPVWETRAPVVAEGGTAKAWNGEEVDVVALFSAEEIMKMTEAEYKRKTAGFSTKTFEQARYLARLKMNEK